MSTPGASIADMRPLAGLHVLNTRPRHQAPELSEALVALGAQVTELPLIDIEPLVLSAAEERLLFDLDRYDGIFFVSANASRLGLDAVANVWAQWPWRLPVYATGERTAKVLREAGLSVVVPAHADSEGLLALPDLQEVAGRRFLLFRGDSGRELLPDTLRARGALVDVVALYRRVLPASARLTWLTMAATPPDVVVLTSPDALRHWQDVAGKSAIDPAWLVVSPRLRALAEAAGARVVEAAGADTGSVVAALRDRR
ncbi:MAG TPA: uroporphyrinogen-III synthase [Moraxellaceae bacterium]|nr:uroporphyrinogen-III synthase [Moraxellaceae bacterium]